MSSTTFTRSRKGIFCFYDEEYADSLDFKKGFSKKDTKEFDVNKIIITYVNNYLNGKDTLYLCTGCYFRHKERFDEVIDSLAHSD